MGRTAPAHDHLSVRAYGASHGCHDHGHFQILVGLEGALELEIAGRGQRIAAGDGCVVPPGDRPQDQTSCSLSTLSLLIWSRGL